MALVGEAGVGRDRGDAARGVVERFAGSLDAQSTLVFTYRKAVCLAEAACQVCRVNAGQCRELVQRRRSAWLVMQTLQDAAQPCGCAGVFALPAGLCQKFQHGRLQGQWRRVVTGRQLVFDAMSEPVSAWQVHLPMIGQQMANGGIVFKRVIEMDVETTRTVLGETVGVTMPFRMHQQQALCTLADVAAGMLPVRTVGYQAEIGVGVFMQGQSLVRGITARRDPQGADRALLLRQSQGGL